MKNIMCEPQNYYLYDSVFQLFDYFCIWIGIELEAAPKLGQTIPAPKY